MNKGDKIREMLKEGKKYGEIIKETGAASSTIAYHAKKIGLGKYTFERKVHNWREIQSYYDEGHTYSDISEKYDINFSVIFEARKRGDLITVDNAQRKLSVQKIRINRQLKGETVGRITSSIDDLVEDSQITQATLRSLVRGIIC